MIRSVLLASFVVSVSVGGSLSVARAGGPRVKVEKSFNDRGAARAIKRALKKGPFEGLRGVREVRFEGITRNVGGKLLFLSDPGKPTTVPGVTVVGERGVTNFSFPRFAPGALSVDMPRWLRWIPMRTKTAESRLRRLGTDIERSFVTGVPRDPTRR